MIPLPFLLMISSLTIVESGPAVRQTHGQMATAVSSPQPPFIVISVAVIAALPLLVTTILGMVAISDIRHSQGRLVGLGLAFVDAIFFPVMIGNGFAFGMTVENFGMNSSPIVLLVLVIINILGIRFLWKNATAGMNPLT